MGALKQYSFSHYVSDVDVQLERNLVRTEANNEDSWVLALLPSPLRILLTLNSNSNGRSYVFYIKVSLFDEYRHATMISVKRGWKHIGSSDAFPIDQDVFTSLTGSNCHTATIHVSVIKIAKPLTEDKLPMFLRSPGNFVMKCGDGVALHCHKDVLAAASSVFAAMVYTPMKESVEDEVEITDFGSDVMSVLLRFVYSGDWGEISQIAESLYMAAHRYELENLEFAAIAELIVNISVDSVVSTIRLARLYGNELLMAECVNFLASRSDNLSLVDVMTEATKMLEGN